MITQPEALCENKNMPTALRLADALDVRGFLGTTASDAAAELRRLHKEIGDWDRVCNQHLKHIDKLKKRMKRAEALNQELLRELQILADYAGAIIAKAEEQA